MSVKTDNSKVNINLLKENEDLKADKEFVIKTLKSLTLLEKWQVLTVEQLTEDNKKLKMLLKSLQKSD